MKAEPPYNPLDKRNLGISVAEAMLRKSVEPLPPAELFLGAGIYAIYYAGDFPAYEAVAAQNRDSKWAQPIYIGKAIPAGGRKGGAGLDAPTGPDLFKRLSEHADSIKQARNLNVEDFYCRYLVVDDVWIPLAETLLINTSRPVWNFFGGFGNHDPGSGRYNQQRSVWDTIHPGRTWADRLRPNSKSEDGLLAEITTFLAKGEGPEVPAET